MSAHTASFGKCKTIIFGAFTGLKQGQHVALH